MGVVLLENTPTVINAVLPPMGDIGEFEARIQRAVQMLKDMPEDVEVHLHRDRQRVRSSFFPKRRSAPAI